MTEVGPCNAYCDPPYRRHAVLAAGQLPAGANFLVGVMGQVLPCKSERASIPCLPVGTWVRMMGEDPASTEVDPAAAGVCDEYPYPHHRLGRE